MDFNKKRKRDFFTESLLFKTVGIIFLVVIVVLIFSDFRIYQKKRELASQIRDYQKQIEDIKKSSQTLTEEIVNSNNVDYLEKIAYEQLGQQKPGEKQVIFIAPQENQKQVVTQENFWDVRFWTSWLSGAFNWIKGRF